MWKKYPERDSTHKKKCVIAHTYTYGEGERDLTVCVCIFVCTDVCVRVSHVYVCIPQVSGHDMQSVLYNYMDEFLFQFCTEGFVARRVSIVAFDKGAHFACFTGTKVQMLTPEELLLRAGTSLARLLTIARSSCGAPKSV